MVLPAVATLAAHHALATATAVAMEASRRQSAPGCLQGVQDPLLGWLGNLPGGVGSLPGNVGGLPVGLGGLQGNLSNG